MSSYDSHHWHVVKQELLYKRHPYAGSNAQELVTSILRGKLPIFHSLESEDPHEAGVIRQLQGVCLLCWNPSSSQRVKIKDLLNLDVFRSRSTRPSWYGEDDEVDGSAQIATELKNAVNRVPELPRAPNGVIRSVNEHPHHAATGCGLPSSVQHASTKQIPAKFKVRIPGKVHATSKQSRIHPDPPRNLAKNKSSNPFTKKPREVSKAPAQTVRNGTLMLRNG